MRISSFFYVSHLQTLSMEAYFGEITTEFDDAGRPYYHPMCIAADWSEHRKDRPNPNAGCMRDERLSKEMREQILGTSHDGKAWNEWSWSHFMAYTDIY